VAWVLGVHAVVKRTGDYAFLLAARDGAVRQHGRKKGVPVWAQASRWEGRAVSGRLMQASKLGLCAPGALWK